MSDHLVRHCEYDEALKPLDQAYKVYTSHEFFQCKNARVHFKRWKLVEVLGKFDAARKDHIFLGNIWFDPIRIFHEGRGRAS